MPVTKKTKAEGLALTIRAQKRRDTAVAKWRGVPRWLVRRERYLVATGRIEQLNAEERAANGVNA